MCPEAAAKQPGGEPLAQHISSGGEPRPCGRPSSLPPPCDLGQIMELHHKKHHQACEHYPPAGSGTAVHGVLGLELQRKGCKGKC